nr:hypothetical protein [Tanacetum cinerariifolium]
MDLISFIRTADPTKVRIGERQGDEDEPKLLETTVGHFVPLLPVAPDRSSRELEASVEKLFGERGSGEQAKQGDSVSGGHGVGIDVVAKTSVEDVAPAQLKHQKKQKTKVADAGEPSHPAKKLRDDYEALGGPNVGGKSQSSIQRLLTGAVQNAEVRGVNIAEAEVDSVVRTSMPIITSATTTTPTADPAAIAKEKLVGSSVFGDDSLSAGESHPIPGGFSDLSGSGFLVGGIRTVIDPDSNLQKVYNLKAHLLLKEAEAMEAIRLRAKTSQLEATEKSLRDEVTALNERNTILKKKRNAQDVKVTDLQAVVVSKDCKLTNSAAQLTSIMSHNDNLTDEEFQDAQLKVVNDKFDKLYADFVEVTLHLEEKFYPYLLTIIAGHRWLLTHGMELAIAKHLRSLEYLSTLRTAISKSIEKGMQDGLAARITHGRECRALTDVAVHNPAAETDYVSSLQQLQMRLGLNESQPHVDQLMVPIHHSPDKTVVGASAISLALDVSDARVQRIKENIMIHRSLFQDVFVPFAEPLSAAGLTGIEGTSGAALATADLTTALFVTLTSAGTVTPLFIDDYKVMGTNDQLAVDENANPFLNVDDVELNIPQ